MFLLIAFGWLIFRSPSLGWLANVLLHSPWIHGRSDAVVAVTILSMTLAYASPLIIKYLLDRYYPHGYAYSFYYAVLTLGIVIFTSSVTSDFIYFQF
jgi:hypothetical protein